MDGCYGDVIYLVGEEVRVARCVHGCYGGEV